MIFFCCVVARVLMFTLILFPRSRYNLPSVVVFFLRCFSSSSFLFHRVDDCNRALEFCLTCLNLVKARALAQVLTEPRGATLTLNPYLRAWSNFSPLARSFFAHLFASVVFFSLVGAPLVRKKFTYNFPLGRVKLINDLHTDSFFYYFFRPFSAAFHQTVLLRWSFFFWVWWALCITVIAIANRWAAPVQKSWVMLVGNSRKKECNCCSALVGGIDHKNLKFNWIMNTGLQKSTFLDSHIFHTGSRSSLAPALKSSVGISAPKSTAKKPAALSQ